VVGHRPGAGKEDQVWKKYLHAKLIKNLLNKNETNAKFF